jgi:hypothetical protein
MRGPYTTDKQIDAAWTRILGRFDTPEDEEEAFAIMAELGIERCEGCDGVGHWEQEPQTGGAYPNQKPTCSDCDGKGWVRVSDILGDLKLFAQQYEDDEYVDLTAGNYFQKWYDEIERLREIAKQNIAAKYEIGRILGCPEHEELLPWIVRYKNKYRQLCTKIERLKKHIKELIRTEHYITEKQIDAALYMADKEDRKAGSTWAYRALEELGIERMEAEGGKEPNS